MYCQGKMEEEENLKEKEIQKRRMSINRRESVYRKERRKSDGKRKVISISYQRNTTAAFLKVD